MYQPEPSAATDTPDTDPRVDQFRRTGNLAPLLDQQQLAEIAMRCFEGIQNDRATMGDWHQTAKEARELAKMQVKRELPFEMASNVQTPTLAIACMQFAARAYPSILNNDRPVKVKSFGQDPQGEKAKRAERVADFMSWQVTEDIQGWDEDVDDMLHILPLVGTAFKKVYFCPSRGKPVSELVPMENLIFDITSKRGRIPRMSERMDFYGWEIEERMRRGSWIKFDPGQPTSSSDENEDKPRPEIDESSPHVFYEQHCRIDLDKDGYEEPYIVMLHEGTQQIVRISPNYRPSDVERDQMGRVIAIKTSATYIPFKFIPDPDNRAMGVGYGTIMVKLGSAINTILNQLIDAGSLANAGGGIINKGIKGLAVGDNEVDVSKWYKGEIPDDVGKLFVEFPRPRPDATLFSLLGFLVEMSKEVTSTTDALSGNIGENVQPTTLLALIEQGQKVFNAIYKRIFRSLKEEYQALYRLNAAYMPQGVYLQFHDQQVTLDDFRDDGFDISPAADPAMASDMAEMARIGVIEKFIGDPFLKQGEARRRIFRAARIDEGLLLTDDEMAQQSQGPDPQALAMQMQMQMESDKIAVQERKAKVDETKAMNDMRKTQILQRQAEADIALKEAQALKALADAEAAEAGIQMGQYQRELQTLGAMQDEERLRMDIDEQRFARALQRTQGEPGLSRAPQPAPQGVGGPSQPPIR